MTIWNLKRLMSFRDNDLKDACLPILAPVIDQIWSVVLANPPGVMLSEYARWQAWQGTGEWTQQNSHLASIPRHICSSFVLPFLLCGLPTSFYAPWLPLFWTTCPTLSSSAIDLGIYIFTWIWIFEKLERRRVFGRSTPVVVKQIPRLFTLSCLLSWPFLQPHRTAHSHLDHELLK